MTEQHSSEKLEAIQAVVDRVSSWLDGATEGTVEQELRDGFSEAGVDVTDSDVTRLADAIQSEHGAVSAAERLAERHGLGRGRVLLPARVELVDRVVTHGERREGARRPGWPPAPGAHSVSNFRLVEPHSSARPRCLRLR